MPMRIGELELLRLIDFLDAVREPFGQIMSVSDDEPIWKIVSYLIRADIIGHTVTISALCEISGLPYATARRQINGLIEKGHIRRIPRSDTGKSFALIPSDELKVDFEAYTRQIKAALSGALGNSAVDSQDEYYFGGRRHADVLNERASEKENIRFLLNQDPYAESLRNMWSDFRISHGRASDCSILAHHSIREQLLANGAQTHSSYDVVAVNVPWLPELAEKGLLVDLTSIATEGSDPASYLEKDVLGKWRGKVFGMPIYQTANLLAVRSDLFAEAGLDAPLRPDDVIAAGRMLANKKKNLHGLIWDAAEGTQIANSFMFFMADFGKTYLSNAVNVSNPTSPNELTYDLAPAVMSDVGFEVLDFMHRLVEISPPNILDMRWHDTLQYFFRGGAAMSYCWSLGAVEYEYNVRSLVKRRISYLPRPSQNRQDISAPLGGFLLAVPANLHPDRIERAVQTIQFLSKNGEESDLSRSSSFLPDFALSADPEKRAGRPIVEAISKLRKKGILHNRARPTTPHFGEFEVILGHEIHQALSGAKSDREALRDASERMLRSMRT